MNVLKFTLYFVLAILFASSSFAAMQRNPTGVNVSSASPTSLVIRFADSAGATFTTTQAFFCSEDPSNGAGVVNANASSCAGVGGRVLGRLPLSLDRGSSSTATQTINDIMTIPISVVRRAVVEARQGQNSDFFYVRRFDPVGAANLGAGAGVPVLVVITCRLSGGTARTPLSITKVVLFGVDRDEDEPTDKILKIRLDAENFKTGRVYANINTTGMGSLSGWWEVRTPSDPKIRKIDRYTEASLTESERLQQQRFQRIKKFNLTVPLSGALKLTGPSYKDLPRSSPGRYEILLRIGSSTDREAMSSLQSAGGTPNLFSGGVAGFPLPILEYWVEPFEDGSKSTPFLAPSLVFVDNRNGMEQVGVSWTGSNSSGFVVRLEAFDRKTSTSIGLLAPIKKRYAVFPPEWMKGREMTELEYFYEIYDASGAIASPKKKILSYKR